MLGAIQTVIFKKEGDLNWRSGLHIINNVGNGVVVDLETLNTVDGVWEIINTGKLKINF